VTRTDPTLWQLEIDLRGRMLQLMKKMFFTPGKTEADVLGEYRFSSDQGETVLRPFAPPLTLWDSLSYIRLFRDFGRQGITFWLHGSRMRSAWHINLFLTVCSRLLVCLNEVQRSLRTGPAVAAGRDEVQGISE